MCTQNAYYYFCIYSQFFFLRVFFSCERALSHTLNIFTILCRYRCPILYKYMNIIRIGMFVIYFVALHQFHSSLPHRILELLQHFIIKYLNRKFFSAILCCCCCCCFFCCLLRRRSFQLLLLSFIRCFDEIFHLRCDL